MDFKFVHPSFVTVPEPKYRKYFDLMIEFMNNNLRSVCKPNISYVYTKARFDLYINKKLQEPPNKEYFAKCCSKIIELSQNGGWHAQLVMNRSPKIILSFIIKKKEKYCSKANRNSTKMGINHIIYPSYMVINNILNHNKLLKDYFLLCIKTMNSGIEKSTNMTPRYAFNLSKETIIVPIEHLICVIAVKLNISGWSIDYSDDKITLYTMKKRAMNGTIYGSPYY